MTVSYFLIHKELNNVAVEPTKEIIRPKKKVWKSRG